jgi:predicted O-linked N-acetylglucosamine transferase (SPINDLY family)
LGYPNTTGLSTIDYRIVDYHTDPPGLTDPFYTEKLIRMPESFLCYLPDKNSPTVGELSAIKNSYVTFGSFNAFQKVSPQTIELWASILNALPDSCLILKAKSFIDNITCNSARELFTAQGISHDRVELIAMMPSFIEHLNLYKRVDIALDTFPYNGTTTTCEAMWMGLPVMTLAGNTHASRVGASLLSNVGLSELIARTPDEYIELTTNLAKDIDKLQFLRKNIRDMMAKSPLCDVNRFISNLEDCYRQIWRNWCAFGQTGVHV